MQTRDTLVARRARRLVQIVAAAFIGGGAAITRMADWTARDLVLILLGVSVMTVGVLLLLGVASGVDAT